MMNLKLKKKKLLTVSDKWSYYVTIIDSDYIKYQIEELINNYEQLKKLREEIQVKYFPIYEELLAENLIEGELDASIWGITQEHENEIWNSEIRLMSDIKREFDMGIAMIESGKAEQAIIDDENQLWIIQLKNEIPIKKSFLSIF